MMDLVLMIACFAVAFGLGAIWGTGRTASRLVMPYVHPPMKRPDVSGVSLCGRENCPDRQFVNAVQHDLVARWRR